MPCDGTGADGAFPDDAAAAAGRAALNAGADLPDDAGARAGAAAERGAFADRIDALRRLLAEVYGDAAGTDLLRSLLQTVAETREHGHGAPVPAPGPARWSERDVVLISYAHSVVAPDERPLATLAAFLRDRLDGLVSTVHLLPFYPWSSDDGFAVIDYFAVDPQFGTWEDVRAIAERFALMADLVVNHVSRESLWFIDFIADREPGRDFFLTVDPAEDTTRVVRPRNTPLLVPIHTYRGLRHVWATFSEDQIDLDFANPRVFAEMMRVLCTYLAQGARVIRLDAIAYLWKELGTPCIHHPHTHRLVRAMRLVSELACEPEVDPVVLITETNVPHSENVSYFGRGDEAHLVYQFPLAPLTLHALVMGTSRHLMQWAGALGQPPAGCTFLNFTASHDGIGLRPAEGLVPEAEIDALVALMHRFGGFVSMRALADGSERPYEINVSLFDALRGTVEGEDALQVPRFLASQTLMLSLQGIPALYLHSLLATPNDLDGVERTGRLRSINRRQWTRVELDARLADTDGDAHRVFEALAGRLRVRREEPAFAPDAPQTVLPVSDSLVTLRRGEGPDAVLVVVNVTDVRRHLDGETLADLGVAGRCVERITGRVLDAGAGLHLDPYQCLWLKRAHTDS
jgi:sucrose phosphorylase